MDLANLVAVPTGKIMIDQRIFSGVFGQFLREKMGAKCQVPISMADLRGPFSPFLDKPVRG